MESLCSIKRIALVCIASTLSAPAAVSIYLSPNGIESAETSGISGVTTENFTGAPLNHFSSYSGSIGSYAGHGYGINENIYGGNGEGRYIGIYIGDSLTLSLTTGAAYFGFYFSAGDPGNVVQLYNGSTLLLTFDTGNLIAMLPKNPTARIQAINGNYYNTINYYGQPNSEPQQNGGEPYAYVHFVGTGGTTFDKIVFSEPDTATFETDNHSVRATAPTLPTSLVDITHAVPEPSGPALILSSLATLALFRRRRA